MKWRSPWPVFHGPVILPYIVKTIWRMNNKLLSNESVWHNLDLEINVGHSDLYFTVQWFCLIISKTIWWMSVVLSDNETVWPNLWPQNKYVSMTYTSWSSDFALYLDDCLMDECNTLDNQSCDSIFDLKINISRPSHLVLYLEDCFIVECHTFG